MPRPTFTHPVFEQLYTRDYFIADEVLRDILALGPAAAVPELLKIANAALDDNEAIQKSGDDWSASYYLLHALYLLHELHAPEVFDVYRRLLRLDAETTDFWFSDYLFEEVPPLLARAALTRLPELLALLDDPQVLLMHRLVVAEALSRLAREQPALRPAISEYVQQQLRRLIADPRQGHQLFPPDAGSYGYKLEDYLAGLLVDMQEANLRELEPEMRALHRLGLVDETLGGGEADLHFEDKPLLPAPDIFARYQPLRDDPDSYSPFHPDAAAIAQRRAEKEAELARRRAELLARPQPRVAPPKPGRNDPCYCGSGQKYKKCHGA